MLVIERNDVSNFSVMSLKEMYQPSRTESKAKCNPFQSICLQAHVILGEGYQKVFGDHGLAFASTHIPYT